jgi:hypothetical protein
LSTE